MHSGLMHVTLMPGGWQIARCHIRDRHLTLHITPRENNMKDEQQTVLKGSEPGNVIHQRVDVVLR